MARKQYIVERIRYEKERADLNDVIHRERRGLPFQITIQTPASSSTTHNVKTRLLAHTAFREVSNTDKQSRQSDDVPTKQLDSFPTYKARQASRIIFAQSFVLAPSSAKEIALSSRQAKILATVIVPPSLKPVFCISPFPSTFPKSFSQALSGKPSKWSNDVDEYAGVVPPSMYISFFLASSNIKSSPALVTAVILVFDHAFEAESSLATSTIVGFASAMVTGAFRIRCANVGDLGFDIRLRAVGQARGSKKARTAGSPGP
ncbi:hypothetical protein ABVK25_007027 [Lepraria finkii]|uniref:Uncharacterized protein n=1 Tax=Lepraria finkii TaxID=1340010 RepID=A0ABR4B637_9LECA